MQSEIRASSHGGGRLHQTSEREVVMSSVSEFMRKLGFRRSSSAKPRRKRSAFAIEPLESRVMPAVTASFLPTAGLLTVFGDNANNTIDISRNAAGAILVNNGAVAVSGGVPTVANTAQINAFG